MKEFNIEIDEFVIEIGNPINWFKIFFSGVPEKSCLVYWILFMSNTVETLRVHPIPVLS